MKNLFLFIIMLMGLQSHAQSNYTQTIRGVVLDKYSQTTLPGATVILLNSNPIIGTVTDTDGNFKLEHIPVGRHGIAVSYLGYNTTTLSGLNLSSGKEIVLTIELEEQLTKLSEVVISASQPKDVAINKMATVSARSFTVEETEKYAGSLGDPSRMVANFAGVSMTNDQRNDIVIRGNSPFGLLWRLDGIEIPNPNHFGAAGTTGGPVSMLNNNLLTNSDFFTSAFPAEYGNAMSGVFDLKMRNGNNQKREYVGQIGFNGFELGAEGPFSKNSKASYMANYRYSTLGVFDALGLDIGVGQAIPQYQDLTFKLNFPSTKYGRLSIVGLGGKSFIELHDSEVALTDNDDNAGYNYGGVDLDYGSDMGVIGISHLYFFNNNTRLETYASVLGNRATTYIDSLKFDTLGSIIQGSNFKFYESTNTEIKYSFSTHLKKKLNARNNGAIGIYYDLYDVKYLDSVKIKGFDGFYNNFDTKGNLYLIRGYGQWQHRFSDRFKVNVGVYSQYVGVNKEFVVEPRLGLKYNITNSQSLSAGYGLHSQMLPRVFYFLQTLVDTANLVYDTPYTDLKMPKSHQFVLGYDNLLSKDFRFKAEAYYQYLFDIPVSKVTPQFATLNGGDAFVGFLEDSLVNIGTGTNYGVELTLEKFFSKGYYFLGTLSLFESKYKDYNGDIRNTAFNGNFVANVLGGYEFKIGKRNTLGFSIRTVYAGGKRYIPIDIAKSIKTNFTEYNWSKAYENKFDDYFRTDLRISFKMNGKKFNQEWAIDLQNLSDNQNIYSEQYNPRTKGISRSYQTGFFPMFLYRIQF